MKFIRLNDIDGAHFLLNAEHIVSVEKVRETEEGEPMIGELSSVKMVTGVEHLVSHHPKDFEDVLGEAPVLKRRH